MVYEYALIDNSIGEKFGFARRSQFYTRQSWAVFMFVWGRPPERVELLVQSDGAFLHGRVRLSLAGQLEAKAPLAHAYRGAEASAYRHGSEPNAVSAPLARAAAQDEQMEAALALLVARHVL